MTSKETSDMFERNNRKTLHNASAVIYSILHTQVKGNINITYSAADDILNVLITDARGKTYRYHIRSAMSIIRIYDNLSQIAYSILDIHKKKVLQNHFKNVT